VKSVSQNNHFVTIKGTRDGLVFLMDDQVDFSELMSELTDKLGASFEKFVDDSVVLVTVKVGGRDLSEQQKYAIAGTIGKRANLVLQSIESQPNDGEEHMRKLLETNVMIHRGTIRSGQVLEHDGNLLFLGDINPGGSVVVSGDLYVMGALRGMAHAGSEGNEHAVIAASHLFPTQLRIAGFISRPPDEWLKEDVYMEFAFLEEGQMKIDKLSNLSKRKQLS
jgi:septum site-determining protein MinC